MILTLKASSGVGQELDPIVGAITGIVKANGAGVISAASAGTDYEVPLTFGDGLTRTANDIDVDTTQNIAKLSNLTSNGFIKTSGGDGTLSVDTNTYIVTGLALLLDQSTPQTITASPKFSWLTATRIPYVGALGVLTDSANLTYDDINTLNLGNNLAPATIIAEDWTLAGDCNISGGELNKFGGHTAGGAILNAVIPTVGATYKVVIVCSAQVGGACTYTFGGVAGTPITAGTTTDYITATTVGTLIIQAPGVPFPTTFNITSITITPQVNLTATGTVTGGNIIDSALTSGRVVVAGTSGLLGDYSTLTYSGTSLSANPDTDTTHTFGRAKISNSGLADFAAFSHYDYGTAITNYAFAQYSNGATYINAVTGQAINNQINNVDKLTIAGALTTSLNPTTINTNSTTALLVEQDGVKDNTLVVDTTNGKIFAGSAPATAYARLIVGENAVGSNTIGILSKSDSMSQLFFGDGLNSTAEYEGVLRYDHATDYMEFWTTHANRMTLNSTGLGIGCTPATFPLELKGNGTSAINGFGLWTNTYTLLSAGSVLRFGHGATSGNTYSTIDAIIQGGTLAGKLVLNPTGGNVGIGLTDPATALDIDSNSDTQCITGRAALGTTDYFSILSDSLSIYLNSSNHASGYGYINLTPAGNTNYGILIKEHGAGLGAGIYTNIVTNNAATDYTNIVCNAANSTLGLTIDANQNVGVGGLYTAPSTAYTVGLYNQPMVNNAKFELIEDINNLVGTSNIKGFWIFDQTGATTSITDRSPNAHTLTLGGNASTLSPAVAGLCPNLTMAGTAATGFSTAYTGADLTPTANGFTVITLVNPTSMTGLNLGKSDTNARAEWGILEGAGSLYWQFTSPNTSKYTYVSVANPAYTNGWHTLIGTASTNTEAAAMVLYGDGAVLADVETASGGAFTVTNGASPVANYGYSTVYSSAKYGVVIIIDKELTSAEVSRIDKRLRAYAGSFI